MHYKIVHLPKETWKGHALPIDYTTDHIYEVSVGRTDSGFEMKMQLKALDTPVHHGPEEYDFPDKLYAEYWEDACAWGVIENDELVAAIETCPEKWSNRLRVTELWIDPKYQKKGIGRQLMNIAKEQARLERRRAVILETQSCNVNAIGFYLHEGFTLIGFDACCYTNTDIERGEVRIELGWFPTEKVKLSRDAVEIRSERPEDYHETEAMTRRAFFNKYRKGCDEHYLVHIIRQHPDYLPGLSRIAVLNGRIIGAIFYSKSWVIDGEKKHETVTFGPLCVEPEYQGCGVGEMLIRETLPLVAGAGYPGVIIFGEPDYYPKRGFKTSDHFGITTPDGRNFDAFMACEVVPGGFVGIRGRFHESDAFENIDQADVQAFDKQFPMMEEQYYPCQW